MVDTQTQTEKKQVEEFVSSDDTLDMPSSPTLTRKNCAFVPPEPTGLTSFALPDTEDANNLTQGKTSKNPSDSSQQVTGREGKGVMTGGVEKLGVGKDWGAGNEADTEPMKGGHPST
ncbi:hypothetical protein D0864_10120 [Hortaea werneckii]|uniref:Uncharacterized protein n=1 Tax=Hortaea werneckii TaxID=91943 RepID=A0A3M7EBF2_HORWE|nr:hypothetical protein D0864_10120 [Hortaea werneckii]